MILLGAFEGPKALQIETAQWDHDASIHHVPFTDTGAIYCAKYI